MHTPPNQPASHPTSQPASQPAVAFRTFVNVGALQASLLKGTLHRSQTSLKEVHAQLVELVPRWSMLGMLLRGCARECVCVWGGGSVTVSVCMETQQT